MNKGINKILFLMMLCCTVLSASGQQDAQFSQYMFNGMYINPAYAGYREYLNINMFYRNQWAGLPGAPKTFSGSVDGTVASGRVGLGLMLMNDKIGAQENTSLYGSYAYRIPFDEEGNRTLSVGIGAGFIQQRLNVAALSSGTANDPMLYDAQKTAFMPDAKVGIFYNTERWFAGLAADNLMSGNFQKSKGLRNYVPLKPHMYLTAGVLVPVTESVLFKPSLLVKEDFAGPTSMDLNAFFLLDERLWVGASYRMAIFNKKNVDNNLTKAGAVVGMVEYFVNEKLRIGYAYDQTVNGTAANGYTTHEVSLNYLLVRPRARMMSPRYF